MDKGDLCSMRKSLLDHRRWTSQPRSRIHSVSLSLFKNFRCTINFNHHLFQPVKSHLKKSFQKRCILKMNLRHVIMQTFKPKKISQNFLQDKLSCNHRKSVILSMRKSRLNFQKNFRCLSMNSQKAAKIF